MNATNADEVAIRRAQMFEAIRDFFIAATQVLTVITPALRAQFEQDR